MENIKKFEDFLDRMQGLLDNAKRQGHIIVRVEDLENTFPELKESEDEKIKKVLIGWINLEPSTSFNDTFDGFSKEQILAWLEKQVSQDNTEDVDILHRFSFYSYKDEPNVLYLSGLYVNEEYRNKGIGTKILEVADEVVKSLNCRAIRLKTRKDSDAERLYRIHGYNSLATEDKDEIWLEKQCEQKKSYDTCDSSMMDNKKSPYGEKRDFGYFEEKPADKVEPKFHEGEWVVQGDNILKIKCVGDTYYCFETVSGYVDDILISEIDSQFHLWTIQDAEDGDVLYSPSHRLIWIYKDNERYHASVNLNYANVVSFDNEIVFPSDVCPANRVQRSILFQKMKESGYAFDFEKKELKKIELRSYQWNISDFRTWQYIVSDVLTKHDGIGQYLDNGLCKKIAQYMQEEWSKKLCLVQHPAEWNEEDEYNFAFIQEALLGLDGDDSYREKCCKMADWLKSLKDKVGCEVNCTTTKQWSEEDALQLNEAIEAVNESSYSSKRKDVVINWLQSLKDRVGNFDDGYKVGFSAAKHNQWKPSDRQMASITCAVRKMKESACYDSELVSLLNDLKKLKRE